jgi:feruloyl esterase
MQKIHIPIMLCAWILSGPALFAAAQPATCAALKTSAAPDVVIESAMEVPPVSADAENSPSLPPLPNNWKLPAYCRIRGVLDARTGADGSAYGIHFELRLPTPWNGKFLFQGGGGTDGVVQPAVGIVNFKDLPALSRGYAVVATDSGHEGGANTAFGREQQARLDYAFNAIGEVTRVAKQLLAAYYEKPASRTYFVGCSNGGREAMIAVQRYPLEFDGAVAGDPGFRLSHSAVAEAWDTQTFSAIAPLDGGMRPILGKAFTNADLSLVSKAVLDQCDALDGIRDGEINNVSQCKFDPEILVCKGEKTPQCLSRQQIDALRRSFNGVHDSKGTSIYSSWPYDAGIADMGWRIWKLGTSETATSNAINATFGAFALKDYFVHPYLPRLDVAQLDFDSISAQVEATRAINDATSTDLGTFAARGGKLLIYEGVSDPVFSVNDLIDYYDHFAADNGGIEKARSVARLFLIPGMVHCGGGPATDEFDSLTALEQWVEAGKAPASLLATGHTFPGRTRPLCAYPQYAFYNGSGDSESATSFTCK